MRTSLAEEPAPTLRSAAKFYTYIYRDPRPSKGNAIIYVGKGAGKRANSHCKTRKHSNPLFKRVLNKIRKAGFEPIVEIIAWHDEETDAFSHEKRLIAQIGRRSSGSGTLCNLTDGGEGSSGLTKEARHRIGAATRAALTGRKCHRRRGYKLSEEHCKSISKRLTGRFVSDQTRERLRVKNTGKKASEETRRKLSVETLEKRKVSLRLAWERRREPGFAEKQSNGLKCCKACKEWKPLTYFNKAGRDKYGNQKIELRCKPCHSVFRRPICRRKRKNAA